MRKTVWLCFGIALVLVIAIAEIGEYYTGIEIHWFLRIAIVFGVTMGAIIFSGTFSLIDAISKEKPLAGTVRDTLGADRKIPAAPIDPLTADRKNKTAPINPLDDMDIHSDIDAPG